MAEIKSAYRRLARKLHPDVNGNSEKATEDFAIIAKAYEVLSDSDERTFFDNQLAKAKGLIHSTDSVFYSDNSHAQKLRQMAIERRYNDIVDQMIAADRDESLALRKVIFPIVACFVSTFAVAVFRPAFWSNSAILGKIVLLTLFTVGLLRLFKTLREGFERFTYSKEKMHDSVFEEDTSPVKPYSRFSVVIFLLIGFAISLFFGIVVGNSMEMFVASMIPNLFSANLKLEFVVYPPIVVLLVDIMHTVITKFEQ